MNWTCPPGCQPNENPPDGELTGQSFKYRAKGYCWAKPESRMVASHVFESKERLGRQRFLRKVVHASIEFLGQRDDDARGASHVAESILVLVLCHLADEFGADCAQASDSLV